jgi:drug/metabolite transporter (DMT)-like permease
VQVALQLGCISWAAGSICAAGLSRTMPPLIVAGGQMSIAGVLLGMLATIHGDPFDAPVPSAQVAGALLCLALVGSVIGYSCYAVALEQLSVTTVSLHAYVNPIVALIAAKVLHHRAYDLQDVTAILMILAGVTLALTSDARNRSASTRDRAVPDGGLDERVRVSLPQ